LSSIAPVAHIWYFRNAVNYIALLLEMPSKAVEKVISFSSWLVLDPGDAEGLVRKQLLTDEEYRDRKIKGEKSCQEGRRKHSWILLKDVDLYKMR